MAGPWHGKRYAPPQDLPAGFYDRFLSPVAEWIRGAVIDAYETGYHAGRLDELDATTPQLRRPAKETGHTCHD